MRVQVHYPGLCQETTRAGNPRWRVRVEGRKSKKITIPVGPNDPDFKIHYEAAREGKKVERSAPRSPARGTLDEMCGKFLSWMEGQVEAGNLSELTLKSRRTGLKQACDCKTAKGVRIGAVKADLPREAFVKIRDSFGVRTGAADTCLKALRALYKWGRDYGYPENSPVFDVSSNHRSKGGAVPWSQEDCDKFLARHGPGTMARRWFLLARDTAGRIGDTYLLGPEHMEFIEEADRAFIAWQPAKKGSQRVKIPISKDLLLELAAVPEDASTFLLTEHGRPFASSKSFGNRVSAWVVQAGLFKTVTKKSGVTEKKATRSQHGVRKARAQEIAEQGGSVYEVMSILSHSDPRTAATYTKLVDRARLALQAADRVQANNVLAGVPRPQKRGTPEYVSPNVISISRKKWQPVGPPGPCFMPSHDVRKIPFIHRHLRVSP